MIGFKPSFMHTFDSSILKKNWKAVNKTPLQQAGIYVRRTMRDLIRPDRSKKNLPAKPGRPPKARKHKGIYPFRMIFSEPDTLGTSVAIGHFGFRPGANQTVMSIHEFGETQVITVPVKPGPKRPTTPAQRASARRMYLSGRLRRPKSKRATVRINYPRREFANPALEKNLSKIPTLWKGSFNSASVQR